MRWGNILHPGVAPSSLALQETRERGSPGFAKSRTTLDQNVKTSSGLGGFSRVVAASEELPLSAAQLFKTSPRLNRIKTAAIPL